MMTLPDKLVEKLACPRCHGELKYLKEAGRLECHACQIAFRITDDIPMLEIGQAEKLQ
jgi:uncharacterized protein YbaR (Trm112 family)